MELRSATSFMVANSIVDLFYVRLMRNYYAAIG